MTEPVADKEEMFSDDAEDVAAQAEDQGSEVAPEADVDASADGVAATHCVLLCTPGGNPCPVGLECADIAEVSICM